MTHPAGWAQPHGDIDAIRERAHRWARDNPETARGEWGTTPQNQAARDLYVLVMVLARDEAVADHLAANPQIDDEYGRRWLNLARVSFLMGWEEAADSQAYYLHGASPAYMAGFDARRKEQK